MARTVPLPAKRASVVLDASGNGTVTLVPNRLETWFVTSTAVRVTSNTKEPTATTYVGAVADGNTLSSTFSGSRDSSPEQQTLQPGQPLLCQWSGGDPGATATLTVLGTVTYQT
jgi:hypothetical protein